MKKEADFSDIYSKKYVKIIIDNIIKGLTVLAVLSLDVQVLFWVRGLKAVLDDRIRKYEQKQKQIKKF